jgi:thioester reductase-like protein
VTKTLFITGFPGFLASELLRLILREHRDYQALCLVQPKFRALAHSQLAELIQKDAVLEKQISFIEGDITLPHLGLPADFNSPIDQIFHLAAVYDLGVSRELGVKVNLEGTQNVLDFARKIKTLERFHYVSTCYVSGKFEGEFLESDLEKGQSFNNFYEETKYLAEVIVQREMRAGLPTTVYRPSVVVGNSQSGETQKFDGPYYVIQWLLRAKHHALLPKFGDPSQFTVNLVPSDFVCDGIAKLSQHPETLNQVYQLADPRPLTVQKLLEDLSEKTKRKIVSIPLPFGITKTSLELIPGIEAFLKIPASTLNYFVHPTRYSTAHATPALRKVGIECPSFPSYSGKLISFMKSHPSQRTQALS